MRALSRMWPSWLLCLGFAAGASAQTNLSSDSGASGAPPAPVPPEVVTREGFTRVTVRATRIAEPIVLDGRLTEEIYTRVRSISDFVQQEPREGEPATEKTDVWLLFDDDNVYVSAICWDTHPERAQLKEMRRDNTGLFDNELFMVSLDTFYDRRNAFVFHVNLSGGFSEAYLTDERDYNRDWNTVWDNKVARFERGWSLEMVIPFKSLRYGASDAQLWGVNFRRSVGWKNESSFLSQVPASMGRRGYQKASSYATMVGIEVPSAGRTFEIKPFGIANLTTDRTATPQVSNAVDRDGGLDLKIGVTQGLTADVTFNTDFAQVEVDEQQVNLTRFNLFFAEKRDFFLEGRGIFSFGGVRNNRRTNLGPGGASMGANPNPTDMPNLFFSRRIGLHDGHKVPIRAGARVTGKAGPYSIGLLDIQTGEDQRVGAPATNFGVVRIKRDVLRRSAIGALVTQRSVAASGVGSNQLYGVDGVFSFYQNLNINTYLAKTSTTGVSGRDLSYRAQLDYAADRYGLQLEHMLMDDNFMPEVGFVRRRAFRRNSAYVRFSPRPRVIPAVRKFIWDATYDYVTSPGGRLESRNAEVALRGDMQNTDNFAFEFASNHEALSAPFAIAPDVTIPVGSYSFSEARVGYYFGPQRAFASTIVKLTRGSFYNGDRTELTVFKSRVALSPRLGVEPGLTINWVDLPYGQFTTSLASARVTLALTPRMVVGALTQYVSTTHGVGTNVRFRWEYTPGSDLFVVFNDNRDSLSPGFPALQSRSLVVKVTRLFRM